jgi:PhzF family phenazine biosynthesis protein
MTVARWTAFTRDPGGGNPAGVVVVDALDDDAAMQAVAADVGYSETAFVRWQPGDATADIRYFSPQREVPFCGHATIATGVALADRDPALDRLVLTTRHATVPVDIDRRGDEVVAVLTSPVPWVRPVDPALLDEVLALFGWTRAVLDPVLPPAVANAGAAHLLLLVADEVTLAGMAYAFDALRDVMLAQDWTTVAVVRRRDGHTFDARNAFPVGGVVEDPATGAAAAALGAYLHDRHVLAPPTTFTVKQGHHMGRPSTIDVRLRPDDHRVAVAGTAVPIPD